jgi:hypothetical protein
MQQAPSPCRTKQRALRLTFLTVINHQKKSFNSRQNEGQPEL